MKLNTVVIEGFLYIFVNFYLYSQIFPRVRVFKLLKLIGEKCFEIKWPAGYILDHPDLHIMKSVVMP